MWDCSNFAWCWPVWSQLLWQTLWRVAAVLPGRAGGCILSLTCHMAKWRRGFKSSNKIMVYYFDYFGVYLWKIIRFFFHIFAKKLFVCFCLASSNPACLSEHATAPIMFSKHIRVYISQYSQHAHKLCVNDYDAHSHAHTHNVKAYLSGAYT